MRAASRVVRGVALGAAAIAYAVLAHISNSRPGTEALGAVLAIGPIWLACALLAWRSATRLLALAACALIPLLVWARWHELESHFALLYLVQQAGAYGVLAVTFGRTLGAGRIPLCARFAAVVHGPLSPEVAAYTRSVTVAWTVFFVVVSLALLVLFVAVPLPVWSAFANFCTPALVVLMFAAEYLVRRRALPHMQHQGILATLRAVAAGTFHPSVATPHAPR